ncbi:MAG: response regulator transcription factor, partial [Candidatus Limnocylindria bacterium]
MKVLLVDDDRELVGMLEFAFGRAGLTTLAAHDAPTALARFEREQPDIVVLDIHLGAWNGLEVLKDIRRRSDVPIILLTALDSEEDKLRGLSLGADDYVTKPFSHRELIGRITARLRRRGLSMPASAPPARM